MLCAATWLSCYLSSLRVGTRASLLYLFKWSLWHRHLDWIFRLFYAPCCKFWFTGRSLLESRISCTRFSCISLVCSNSSHSLMKASKISRLTCSNIIHSVKVSIVSGSCPHNIHIGSMGAWLKAVLLLCVTYEPVTNFSLVLTHTE